MAINIMWSNNMKSSILCLILLVSTAAAPVSCPQSIDEAGRNHALNNVSVFNGPPEQKADLIGLGMNSHGIWRWNVRNIDPYLVCRYRDTARTVAFHAVGAKYCFSGINPERDYCR